MKLRNKTIKFFSKNPKYVEIIDTVLCGEEKTVFVIKGRLDGESLQSIGNDLRVTREAIRLREKKGLIKIKNFISRIY